MWWEKVGNWEEKKKEDMCGEREILIWEKKKGIDMGEREEINEKKNSTNF